MRYLIETVEARDLQVGDTILVGQFNCLNDPHWIEMTVVRIRDCGAELRVLLLRSEYGEEFMWDNNSLKASYLRLVK